MVKVGDVIRGTCIITLGELNKDLNVQQMLDVFEMSSVVPGNEHPARIETTDALKVLLPRDAGQQMHQRVKIS